MTGPLDFFTTSRSGDIVEPCLGCAASFAAWAARVWGVQGTPVIAAAAPMTALRMRNERRSTPEGMFESAGDGRNSPSSLAEVGVLMVLAPGLCCEEEGCLRLYGREPGASTKYQIRRGLFTSMPYC